MAMMGSDKQNFTLNNSKYFKVMSLILVIVAVAAFTFSTEFVTSFSQNLVKTTGAVYLCLVILYAFIVLYRFMAKRKLILTLKEVLLTIVFLFIVYDLALLVDKILVLMNRDLEAMPSNIITYITLFCFIVFQKYIFRKEVK